MTVYAVLLLLLLILPEGQEAALLLQPRTRRKAAAAHYSRSRRLLAKSDDKQIKDDDDTQFLQAPDLDAMRARAGVLRTNILRQQLELQQLERQIVCCESPSGLLSSANAISNLYNRTITTFQSSSNVLRRKLQRVHQKSGPKNQKWASVGDFLTHQSLTAGRILSGLVRNPHQLKHIVDPDTPTLLPHVPAILARLDRLEIHVSPILERVLNNKRHLASIEPYLDAVLERFDDIEPHLPWILDNIDVLAPYTGLLLKHIDELLLYADVDEHERQIHSDEYALANQLLPFLEYYVQRLDVIGPHLPLLRPHVPLLLKKNRIAKVSPHMDRLFRRGYLDLSVSANLDVLLYWFGWSLNIPGVPRLFFSMPFSPRLCSFLARRLPKRMVRGYCSGVTCSVDGDYGLGWNQMTSKSSSSFDYSI